MIEKLTSAIKSRLGALGKRDINVRNVRFFRESDKTYALADVSYVWTLNSWDKRVKHSDAIFVLVNDKWSSPLFL